MLYSVKLVPPSPQTMLTTRVCPSTSSVSSECLAFAPLHAPSLSVVQESCVLLVCNVMVVLCVRCCCCCCRPRVSNTTVERPHQLAPRLDSRAPKQCGHFSQVAIVVGRANATPLSLSLSLSHTHLFSTVLSTTIAYLLFSPRLPIVMVCVVVPTAAPRRSSPPPPLFTRAAPK